MSERLDVWLDDVLVAKIERSGTRGLKLAYSTEAIDRYSFGAWLLSLNLPVVAEPYGTSAARAFLDGLLPEDNLRRAIAESLDLKANDTFGLVRALGRDSAGALIIVPEGETPPSPVPLTAAPVLAHGDLERMMRELPVAPLGIQSGKLRLSLAGVQQKLVLARRPDGQWVAPSAGIASTHILKPEVAQFPGTVANEAFCLRFAAQLGLRAAHAETAQIAGVEVLVVERYDRVIGSDGVVRRIHQEDACQALGVPPSRKYEESGGPSLEQVARVLSAASGAGALEDLLRVVTVHTLIGNCDAHAKNISLLHRAPGAIEVAPLYDAVSTRVYPALSPHLAMRIDGVQRHDRITADHLVAEAGRWGMRRTHAREVVADLVARAHAAAEAAAAETPSVARALSAFVAAQVRSLA